VSVCPCTELLENSEKLAENGDIDGSLAMAKQVFCLALQEAMFAAALLPPVYNWCLKVRGASTVSDIRRKQCLRGLCGAMTMSCGSS